MNKSEMIKNVAAAAETTQKQTEKVLDAFASVVIDTLKDNVEERITLPGLGTFKGKEVDEKSGIIKLGKSKGEPWVKPAHKEIKFSVTKSLRNL